MVVLYVNRIITDFSKEDAFTIDRVPSYWKENTLIELEKLGYNGYGKKL